MLSRKFKAGKGDGKCVVVVVVKFYIGWPGKACLRKWHLSELLKELRKPSGWLSGERTFWAEETASAKALRWEHAWYVQGTRRPVWARGRLVGREVREPGGVADWRFRWLYAIVRTLALILSEMGSLGMVWAEQEHDFTQHFSRFTLSALGGPRTGVGRTVRSLCLDCRRCRLIFQLVFCLGDSKISLFSFHTL